MESPQNDCFSIHLKRWSNTEVEIICALIVISRAHVRTNWGKEACFLLPRFDIAANNPSFPCLRKILVKILRDAVNFFL